MAFPAHGALQHNLHVTVFLVSTGTWIHADKTDHNYPRNHNRGHIAASMIGEYA